MPLAPIIALPTVPTMPSTVALLPLTSTERVVPHALLICQAISKQCLDVRLFWGFITCSDAIDPSIFPLCRLVVEVLVERVVHRRAGHVTAAYAHELAAQVLDIDATLVLNEVMGEARACAQLPVLFSENGAKIVHGISAGRVAGT